MASLDGRILGALFVGFIFGIISFFKGLSSMKERREIEDIPTSEIRSIAMGLVEIYGEVIPLKQKMLKSPLSDHDCVYYKFTIEELRQQGKHSQWVTVRKGEAENNFFVKDQTGEVMVDPRGAQIRSE